GVVESWSDGQEPSARKFEAIACVKYVQDHSTIPFPNTPPPQDSITPYPRLITPPLHDSNTPFCVMFVFGQLNKHDPNLRWVGLGMAAGFAVLVVGLWWVQIVSSRDY